MAQCAAHLLHRDLRKHATMSIGSFQRTVSDAAMEQVDRDSRIRWSLRVNWNGMLTGYFWVDIAYVYASCWSMGVSRPEWHSLLLLTAMISVG